MPTGFVRRSLSVLTAAALAVALCASPADAWPSQSPPSRTVDVRLIGINDFHGNPQPPTGSSGRVVIGGVAEPVDAGGAAYLATHVKTLESQAKNSILLSAGDNIGASPLASALFHDEPTIEFLNDIGLDASAVGNHEFDEGYAELKRIQLGGCNPTDGCQFRPTYSGAKSPSSVPMCSSATASRRCCRSPSSSRGASRSASSASLCMICRPWSPRLPCRA